jgi:MoxR-like ATPase
VTGAGQVQARRPEAIEDAAQAAASAARIVANIERVVVGKPDEVALFISALISGGHVLLEDAPG